VRTSPIRGMAQNAPGPGSRACTAPPRHGRCW
jgi:hypothetical protein